MFCFFSPHFCKAKGVTCVVFRRHLLAYWACLLFVQAGVQHLDTYKFLPDSHLLMITVLCTYFTTFRSLMTFSFYDVIPASLHKRWRFQWSVFQRRIQRFFLKIQTASTLLTFFSFHHQSSFLSSSSFHSFSPSLCCFASSSPFFPSFDLFGFVFSLFPPFWDFSFYYTWSQELFNNKVKLSSDWQKSSEFVNSNATDEVFARDAVNSLTRQWSQATIRRN